MRGRCVGSVTEDECGTKQRIVHELNLDVAEGMATDQYQIVSLGLDLELES